MLRGVGALPPNLHERARAALASCSHASDRAHAEGRVLIRRLAQPLTAEARARLRAVATSYLGRAYDARFEWSDETLYCSELVHRALGTSLVTPQRWAQITLTPRARALARRRLGRLPRGSEQLVTPVAIAESRLLIAPP